jgi:hypothetical protein
VQRCTVAPTPAARWRWRWAVQVALLLGDLLPGGLVRALHRCHTHAVCAPRLYFARVLAGRAVGCFCSRCMVARGRVEGGGGNRSSVGAQVAACLLRAEADRGRLALLLQVCGAPAEYLLLDRLGRNRPSLIPRRARECVCRGWKGVSGSRTLQVRTRAVLRRFARARTRTHMRAHAHARTDAHFTTPHHAKFPRRGRSVLLRLCEIMQHCAAYTATKQQMSAVCCRYLLPTTATFVADTAHKMSAAGPTCSTSPSTAGTTRRSGWSSAPAGSQVRWEQGARCNGVCAAPSRA